MSIGFRGSGLGLLAAAVLAAGCQPGAETSAVPSERLILAGVVDETDALAWAGQVEGAALGLLLRRLEAGKPAKPDPQAAAPTMEELLNRPARCRGREAIFPGKLVALEKFTPRGECARLGKLYAGLALLADGGLVAFRCRAHRLRAAERLKKEEEPTAIEVPKVGTAVTVKGLFLKRWAVLDGSGKDYMVMPLLAARPPEKLSGPEAEKLARTRLGRGKLPISELASPPVWRRPVVELARNGALRLDGKLITWKRLEDKLYRQAAALRNPLGDSALAVVVLADPRAPKASREKLRELPGTSMGAKCVLRLEPVPLK